MTFPKDNLILSETNTYRKKQQETYEDYCNELKLLAGDEPKIEKQISVDPISLRESSSFRHLTMLPPPPLISPPRDSVVPLPLSSPTVNMAMMTSSLSSSSSSSSSSPRFGSILSKKKWKNESQASPRQIEKLSRKHSSTNNPKTENDDESRLQRSKSLREGTENRASSEDEFDFWLNNKPDEDSIVKVKVKVKVKEERKQNRRHSKGKNIGSTSLDEDRVKCGSLCLYLPGFGKGKPVRPRKEITNNTTISVRENVISRTVSLEKFECGSWASSAIEESTNNLYFDLPLEFIRTSEVVNDAQMPVSTAFVFNKDVKSVLKTGSKCHGKQSGESPRHVRFSTSSSPTSSCPASPRSCITPRLRRARDDFNAFLEAQTA